MAKKFYGRYTAAATAALKASAKKVDVYCHVSDDCEILVSNGRFVFAMSRAEYDAIARPVFQRDPGNFVVKNGEIQERDTQSIGKVYRQLLEADARPLSRSPFTTMRSVLDVALFYCADKSFVTGYDNNYISAIIPEVTYHSAAAKSAMIVKSGSEPFAVILPVNIGANADIVRAVKAYFVEDPAGHDAAAIAELQIENEELKSRLATSESIFRELKAEYEAVNAAYEELKANKPVMVLETPAADSDSCSDAGKTGDDCKDPETLEELASIDGVELIVNGKQTDSPVSWVYGAEKYKELLTALGFKWSDKKAGYWKKGIAA